MDLSKVYPVLLSVFLGWLLAQLTGIAKDIFYRKRVVKCLLEELSDLQSELDRTLLFYSRQLQIYALKGIEYSIPSLLSNYIFKNYYKDAVLSLNQQQRISFQLIHTLVESINSDILEHEKLSKDIKETAEQNGKEWGNRVICQFKNIASALWHIKYHLTKPTSPSLLTHGIEHEQYLQYLESVDKKIAELIEAAQKLDKNEFDKVYNPENFAKNFK
jgi:hypothetical protein